MCRNEVPGMEVPREDVLEAEEGGVKLGESLADVGK